MAHERRRFGYRRIADMIRAEGTIVNDKRVYRLYRLEDLAVRKRRGKKRLKLERVPLHRCTTTNEVWSLFDLNQLPVPVFRNNLLGLKELTP